VRPFFWKILGAWPDRLAYVAGLEWFAQLTNWGGERSASIWDAAMGVMEGRGAVGWLIAFALISIFMLS